MRGVVARYLKPASASQADGVSAERADVAEAETDVETEGKDDAADTKRRRKDVIDGNSPRAILSTLASLQLLHTSHERDAAVLGTALYGLVYGPQSTEAQAAARAVVEQLSVDWAGHEKLLRGGTGAALTPELAQRTVLDYSPLHAVLQDSTVDVPGLEPKLRTEWTATVSNAIARWSAVAGSAGEASEGVVVAPPQSWPDYLARAGSAP